MGLITHPLSAKLCCRKVILSSHPWVPQPSHFHGLHIHSDPLTPSHDSIPCYRPSTISYESWHFRRKKGLLLKPLTATNSSSLGNEEDHRALEAVLKLYTAIQNKNLRELSDILGDECRCVCNFIPFCQAFQGKKQVLAFFSNLIKTLGNNIEFVVQPTTHDGMSIGVAWKLEWKETVPLGKGFSFHICQIYQGRVLIRNVEMFMESFPHMELFRLKMMGFLISMLEKMSSYMPSKSKSKRAGFIVLLVLLSLAAIFVLLLKIQ
ncbi:uncharacterized protein LOC115742982 [Rhodamnia argentea]|uniref:Uncharacterized protein LOC115742982 n=1 Tax=Rhodamnia argentea TaxID=178133 RepID=A0A8B8PFF9_9MYRT|nr:uncharacterized protein LOC115742982 [Rhodamnia argentea]